MSDTQAVQDRLNELAKLEDDWASYGGGKAYSPKHMAFAFTIITKLIGMGMPKPYIFPIPDDGSLLYSTHVTHVCLGMM